MCYRLAQNILKLAVGYSLVAQIELSYGINLGVGIVNIAYTVYKPCVAEGVRIEQRCCLSALQRQDYVLGVEHVEHRID